MSIRSTALRSTAIAFLGAAALTVPTPAMAAVSGGGCGTGYIGGATIRTCISYSGGVLRPDDYFTGAPYPCSPFAPVYDVLDTAGHDVASGFTSGSPGHHVLPTVKPVRGRGYRLRISCEWPDGRYVEISSPWQFV